MAAQIIPFPKFEAASEQAMSAFLGSASAAERSKTSGLHLVKRSLTTQQTALRIVDDVCKDHNLVHPELEAATNRSDEFWATLPVPPLRVETPFSVAKRLAHLVLA